MAVGCALVLTAPRDTVGFGAEIHGPLTKPRSFTGRSILKSQRFAQGRTDEPGARAAPCTGSAGSTQNA